VQQPRRQDAAGRMDLPRWWLLFLSAYNLPFQTGNSLITTLVPLMVQRVEVERWTRIKCPRRATASSPCPAGIKAGNQHKVSSAGVLAFYVSLLGNAALIIGWWTDVGFCGRQCVARIGRRRPFILVGHAVIAVGVLLFAGASNLALLIAAQLVFSFGQQMCQVPMSSILPDIVPAHQRGEAAAWGSCVQVAWSLLAAPIGIALGQACPTLIGYGAHNSDDGTQHASCPLRKVVEISLLLNAACIPLGLMALGARPGCWAPEMAAAPPSHPSRNLAAAARRDGTVRRLQPLLRKLKGVSWSILEPFSVQPFRMMFLGQFMLCLAGIFGSCFKFFWLQELVAPHLTIGGHHLSVVAAQAIQALFEQLASFAALPLGAVLTDRCERRWVYSVAVLLNCQEALVSAWTTRFDLLLCSTIFAGLAGGVCGPAFGALQCDVLPKDPQSGRILHAARDQQLLGYAGFLPGLFLPVWLGHHIDHWPGGRKDAYQQMFLASALCQAIGALCYLAIDLPTNVIEGEGILIWARRLCDPRPGRRPVPRGAQLCDRLLFGHEAHRWARIR
jgi:MFS family permease